MNDNNAPLNDRQESQPTCSTPIRRIRRNLDFGAVSPIKSDGGHDNNELTHIEPSTSALPEMRAKNQSQGYSRWWPIAMLLSLYRSAIAVVSRLISFGCSLLPSSLYSKKPSCVNQLEPTVPPATQDVQLQNASITGSFHRR